MESLLREILKCSACAAHLPHQPRPVVAAGVSSKILIIGQAPGRRVHESGVPWEDQSGKTLRQWLGVEAEAFYNPARFALVPMGFCYPGAGKSGDLPPRPECAPLWHPRLLGRLKSVQLMLLIGQYSQAYYLGGSIRENLTETVRHGREYLPQYLPLPHPSPRNGIWLRRNPWFAAEILPTLRQTVAHILGGETK